MPKDLSRVARHAFSRDQIAIITAHCTTEFEKQKVLAWAARVVVDHTLLQTILGKMTAVTWDAGENAPLFTKL